MDFKKDDYVYTKYKDGYKIGQIQHTCVELDLTEKIYCHWSISKITVLPKNEKEFRYRAKSRDLVGINSCDVQLLKIDKIECCKNEELLKTLSEGLLNIENYDSINLMALTPELLEVVFEKILPNALILAKTIINNELGEELKC